jgi:RimJ/RimL family protein N-acetyltransferase
LIIKPLALDDASVLFAYRSDELVYRYQCWLPENEPDAEDFIRKYSTHTFALPGSWFQLGIYLKPIARLIGDLGVHFLDEQHHAVELGFSIAPEHHRRGFAFEAVNEIFRFLFETMDIERIVASVDPRNEISIAFVEKLGMQKEAHVLKSIFCRGEWVDDAIYALQKRDWTGLTSI